MTTTCTLEQIEQTANNVEAVWTEFVDQEVIEAGERAAYHLRTLANAIRRMRGLPLSTDGHVQFKPEDSDDIWCHESCPRPDEECGELAVQQNG